MREKQAVLRAIRSLPAKAGADRQARWKQIFAFGDRQREVLRLQPSDVERAIWAYRRRATRSSAWGWYPDRPTHLTT